MERIKKLLLVVTAMVVAMAFNGSVEANDTANYFKQAITEGNTAVCKVTDGCIETSVYGRSSSIAFASTSKYVYAGAEEGECGTYAGSMTGSTEYNGNTIYDYGRFNAAIKGGEGTMSATAIFDSVYRVNVRASIEMESGHVTGGYAIYCNTCSSTATYEFDFYTQLKSNTAACVAPMVYCMSYLHFYNEDAMTGISMSITQSESTSTQETVSVTEGYSVSTNTVSTAAVNTGSSSSSSVSVKGMKQEKKAFVCEKRELPKSGPSLKVKAKKKGKAIKVSVSGYHGSSYQIQISKSKKFSKKKTSLINTKKNSVKVKKLKNKKLKKGTYYIRVRAIEKDGSKDVAGSWTPAIRVKF